ncbi:MAG: FAD-binding oxidoreductase [Alphaproteobacteria bacterium]|nr:FAD-binding oxidoreductase [Alphaproteobacteria bacterium]
MQPSQHPTIPSSTEVCIVGAGIVGILCALELVERGHRVLCLEKDRVGWANPVAIWAGSGSRDAIRPSCR